MKYTTKPPSGEQALTLSKRYTVEQWDTLLGESLVVAAYDGKTLVGVTHGHGNGVDWTIEQSIVHPEYRRRGIGSEMRDRINKMCEDQTGNGGVIRGVITNPSHPFWLSKPGTRKVQQYAGIRRID